MCTVCGCGKDEAKIDGEVLDAGHTHASRHEHTHVHADGTVYRHSHAPVQQYRPSQPAASDTLDYGSGPAHAHAPGLSQSRMVQIEQDILTKNDHFARANRQAFDERGIFALNLVSSPGSGKTTLLVKTIELLNDQVTINVVEGDQQTSNDAERIRATGVPALQINTGKGCHLDGQMIGQAMAKLKPAEQSLFLIENVGNLVCPAAFNLGEHHKVVILSVTEGEDKPLKYPDMFSAADVMLLNKCDLLPHLEFDADLAEANARRVNPQLLIFRVSALRNEGMAAWLAWITTGLAAQRAKQRDNIDTLKRRIAELEQQLASR